MKTNRLFPLCSLCMLFLSGLASCEHADTTPPVIILASPLNDAIVEAGGELCIQVTFTDDVALSAYKINIHSNFNGHSHSPARQINKPSYDVQASQTTDFVITLTSASQNDPLTGRNCFRDIDIDIPDDATPGNYHLLVYCTDAAGNEAYIAQDLKIQ